MNKCYFCSDWNVLQCREKLIQSKPCACCLSYSLRKICLQIFIPFEIKSYSRFYEYRVITNTKVNTKPVFSMLHAHNWMSYDSIRKPRYPDFQMLQFLHMYYTYRRLAVIIRCVIYIQRTGSNYTTCIIHTEDWQ